MVLFQEKFDRDSIQYDQHYSQLLNGLLSIGTMGDQGQIMLVLSGPDAGRVVYFNQDLYQPVFPPFNNFLDWYENWLDKSLLNIRNI